MMSRNINVKPARPGTRVRKPDGSHLSETGETVTRSAFWLRRISEGDVIETDAKASATQHNDTKGEA